MGKILNKVKFIDFSSDIHFNSTISIAQKEKVLFGFFNEKGLNC